ncbi:hypothetical protein OG250_12420 [Streptomyces sp. NBC_00487]|uniref:hypothetical protein n=1 Tax=unclassified Streptomyces TaxID=2593676 RepID=UPI002DDB3154|nr:MULTISPECIES: hypothetical protein [unclassified Streptomyces]WRY95603.1 hypothetical protein OG889_13185 [Streptomyces sp. NBC_00481]
MTSSATSAVLSDAYDIPRATVSITTREGLASFTLDPAGVFHLSRSVLDPGNTQLSRRPHCPQIVHLHTGWMLVNRSTKLGVRVAPPSAPWSEIPPGRAHVFSAGTTQVQFLVADVDPVTVTVPPATAQGDESCEDLVSHGRSTVWGPEMNAEANKILRGPGRDLLVAVLAPWLSADPTLQEHKSRRVAAECAGYSVSAVDRILSRLRNALWPDEPRKPSREHIAEYLSQRGLVGPQDLPRAENCRHEQGRARPPR